MAESTLLSMCVVQTGGPKCRFSTSQRLKYRTNMNIPIYVYSIYIHIQNTIRKTLVHTVFLILYKLSVIIREVIKYFMSRLWRQKQTKYLIICSQLRLAHKHLNNRILFCFKIS